MHTATITTGLPDFARAQRPLLGQDPAFSAPIFSGPIVRHGISARSAQRLCLGAKTPAPAPYLPRREEAV